MLIVKSLEEVPKTYSGKILIFRTPKNRRVATVNNLPSRTDPQFADECDTNKIMDRYVKTGQITHLAKQQGTFADVSQIEDLLPSLLKMEKAKESFMQLPPEIRTKFDNKVEKMVEYLQEPKNKQEAIDLGLVPGQKTKPKPPAPAGTPPTPNPTSKLPKNDDDKTTTTPA